MGWEEGMATRGKAFDSVETTLQLLLSLKLAEWRGEIRRGETGRGETRRGRWREERERERGAASACVRAHVCIVRVRKCASVCVRVCAWACARRAWAWAGAGGWADHGYGPLLRNDMLHRHRHLSARARMRTCAGRVSEPGDCCQGAACRNRATTCRMKLRCWANHGQPCMAACRNRATTCRCRADSRTVQPTPLWRSQPSRADRTKEHPTPQ